MEIYIAITLGWKNPNVPAFFSLSKTVVFKTVDVTISLILRDSMVRRSGLPTSRTFRVTRHGARIYGLFARRLEKVYFG
jgi:hypothetical protein